MRTPKNESSAAREAQVARLAFPSFRRTWRSSPRFATRGGLGFSWLALALALGGAALGQTVVEVPRNRFESSRLVSSGSYIINVHDGVTFTYQNSSWLGDANGGGAIYVNGGAFTLGPVDGGTGRSVFTGNMARRGGAITVTGNAVASITNVRFGSLTDFSSGNRTIGDHGGAINILTASTLTLRNAEFYRNVAERGVPAGGSAAGGGFGGAIYLPANGVLEVRDSTFGSLAQPDPVDFFSASWTAAVYAASGADRGAGNWAIDGRGGAIAAQSSAVPLISIYNSRFYHNTAARGPLNANGDGGAIALGSGGQQLYAEDSLFYGNRSRGGVGGGAIYADHTGIVVTLKDTVFTNNFTTGAGGAVYMTGGNLNLIVTKNLTYEGNYAATSVTNSAPVGTKGGFLQMGAAIADINIAPGATLTIGGTANAAHDTISSNNASATINVNSGTNGDTGTLVLHAASTNFSGALNIHAGSVLLGGTAALFTGANTVTVKTGGTFGGIGITRNVAVENGGVLQIGGAGIEGADELYTFLDISGTLRLADGAKVTGHGYIGTAVIIANPDNVLSNAVVLGAAAGDWAAADVAAGDTLTITGTGALTGDGGLVKTGDGALRLYRSGSYTGGTRLEQGTLYINNASALGTGTLSVTGSATRLGFMTGMDFANALDITLGAAVELASNGDVSMQGAITGAGTLQKSGASELMLNTSAAAFTGTVVISGGVLSGGINTASALVLASGTYAGNLTRSAGQLIAGDGGINGNLALNNAALSFDLRNNNTGDIYSSDQIFVSGSVTSTGNNLINLDNVGNRPTNILLWVGDLSGLSLANLSVATVNGRALTNRYDPRLTILASGSALNVSPGVRNLRMTWTGSDAGAPGVWDIYAGNWGESSGERYFRDGDSVIFGAASTGAVAIGAAGVTVGDLAVETAAGQSLAFTGGGVTVTGSLTDSDRHLGGVDGAVYLGGGSTALVAGKLVKTGAGALVFENGANTFAGGVEIHAGTLAFGDGDQLGGAGQAIGFVNDAVLRADRSTSLAGNVTVAAGRTATFDTLENSLDFTGTLVSASTSKLAKAGAGDLWIYNTSHAGHLGGTEVREGRLLLGGNASLGSGAVLVSPGATFGGHGAALNVTALAGSALQAGTPDAAVAEQLAVTSTLTLNAGARVNFNIVSGNASPLASVNSSLSAGALNIIGGGPAGVTIDLDRLANGVYNLGNVSALRDARITYSGQDLGERQKITYESPSASGTLLIKIDMPDNVEMRWTGAVDNAWNINTKNWRLAGSGSAYSFGDGDKIVFDGEADAASPANRVINIAGRRMTLSDMVVSGPADYVFQGGAEIITDASSATPNMSAGAQGKLYKTGAGALAFENAGNQFNGGIEIAGGAVSFTRTEQLRTNGAGITLDSGTLRAAAELLVLAEEIKIGASGSGAFDTAGHTVRYTGAFALGAGGTFVKTGPGALELMADNSASGGSMLVEGGELLLRNDALAATRLGGTVRVASGGAFGGEGEVLGSVTVERGGVLRIGSPVTGQEILSAADLRMEDGSSIYGGGVLAGAMTVGAVAGDIVTLGNITGKPVTITATTSGPGTLVKDGAGVLTLSGTAALGHRETRIAGGLVYLRDIAPAEMPAVAHAFDLAGGWLDLSDARDFGDVPFVTWDNLAFSGSAGGVIGHGDAIKLRDGDTGFQIGGTGAGRGVFVVVDAGSGTATLSGSSNYVGYTRVDSGVLAVSRDASLGNTDASILAPRDVILNGGNLLVTGDLASERKIDMRQGGAVIVGDGVTTSWLDISGTGALTKDGAGTLFLSLPGGETSSHTGAKTVAAGVLQGRAGALAGLINNSGTVALFAGMADFPTGVFSGTIAGGAFAKIGDGTADIGVNAAFPGLAALRVEDGVLASTGRLLALSVASAIDIGDRGTLSLPRGGTLAAAVLRNQGMIRVGLGAGGANPIETLTINGDYQGGASAAAPGYLTLGLGRAVAGRVIDADIFHVTGSAAGTTFVNFTQPAGAEFDNLGALADALPLNVVRVDGGGGAFAQQGRLTYGVKDYVLVYEPGDGTSHWRISIASEIPALVAVDAALTLANQASFGGLSQRLESMGLLDGYKGRQGFDFWVNGIYRRDRFSNTIYSGATANTYGWQAGADYTDSNNSFALGIFMENITSDTDMPYATGTKSETDGFGAYITYRPSNWFFNLMIRLNEGRYDVNVPNTPTFSTDTGGAGISVEVGRYFTLKSGLMLEPQLQFQWARSNIDNTKDWVPVDGTGQSFYGREYRVKPVESTLARASLMLSKLYTTRRGWEVRPYGRAGLAHEFDGKTSMSVQTIGELVRYNNSLGGAHGALNAGATLRIRDRFDLWTDFAWAFAGKIDGYSVNFGAGHRF